MEPNWTSPTKPLLLDPQARLILPSQVWANLSHAQQHRLLQVIVLVCQELVATAWQTQVKEVPHE